LIRDFDWALKYEEVVGLQRNPYNVIIDFSVIVYFNFEKSVECFMKWIMIRGGEIRHLKMIGGGDKPAHVLVVILASCPKLESISFHDCEFEPSSIDIPIPPMEHLKTLISFFSFGLFGLFENSRIKTLIFPYELSMTPEINFEHIKKMKQLENIIIDGNAFPVGLEKHSMNLKRFLWSEKFKSQIENFERISEFLKLNWVNLNEL
jgi:hypothetical protein